MKMSQCSAVALVFVSWALLSVCEARQLRQSQDAQSFYQSFSQKARETGPPRLMALPDALQQLQSAASDGKVSSFIQTNGPGQGSQGEVVPTLQSVSAKPQLQRSKVMQLPKIQTETLLQAADEAVDGLVMAEPALQSRVQQVAANLNPDQAPLLQAVVDAQGGQGNALPVPLTGGLPDGGHVFAEVGTQERGSRPAIAPAPRASAAGTANILSAGQTLAQSVQRVLNPLPLNIPEASAASRGSAAAVAAAQANPATNAFVLNRAISQTGQLLQDYADHLPDLIPLPFQGGLPP